MIFQTMFYCRWNSAISKYQRFTSSCFKDIWIRKIGFNIIAQLLYLPINMLINTLFYFLTFIFQTMNYVRSNSYPWFKMSKIYIRWQLVKTIWTKKRSFYHIAHLQIFSSKFAIWKQRWHFHWSRCSELNYYNFYYNFIILSL